MTVSTIATIAAGLTRTLGNQNARASSALTNLLQASSTKNTNDAANLTAAISLQNQVAQFRVASQDVAQAGTILTTAEAGANEINKQLARLKDIASRAAAPNLSAQDRAQLNDEFQSIRAKIDTIANSSSFNNEALLNGTSAQLKVTTDAADQKNLSIGSLTDAALFQDANPDVLTVDSANAALTSVQGAVDYASTQTNNIKLLQDGLDQVSATLQVAIQNRDAANSSLAAADFTSALTEGTNQSAVLADATSLAAQTNRLPSNLLQLLSE